MKTFSCRPLLPLLALLLSTFGPLQVDAVSGNEFERHGDDESSYNELTAEELAASIVFSGDGFETFPDGSRPKPATEPEFSPLGVAGPIAPSTGQPQGALTGRIVYTSGGHGWQKSSSGTFWTLNRPLLLEMNEAYGNRDQMTMFAQYAFNAGATVAAFRPIGFQTNEVVIDNVDPQVIWNGTWYDSSQNIYYGKPGETPYRWASLSQQETATATYVPAIPEAGFYPVYTWVRHDDDRTFQLYRIRHTGGESQIRIPHHKVGNGWVYLGTYYFAQGSDPLSGAVVISNLQPSPAFGSIVVADAIRFGNGMSTDGSTYPKEDEASRYWVKNSLGVGQSTTLYDLPGYSDGSDNVGAPIRMATEMNRQAASLLYDSIYLGFHSNASGGGGGTTRGSVGLYNTATNRQTPNQLRWARIVGQEVNDQMVAMNPFLEIPWYDRGTRVTYGSAFGEMNNSTINGEFDATIIEVAYHDNVQDTLLLRDPKARNWIARASYRAVLKYMNEFAQVPLNYLPEPPGNVRAIAAGDGEVTVSWDVPQTSAGSGTPTGYLVYRSSDGYGFGQPVRVNHPNQTSVNLENLPTGSPLYFRVSAINAGGESFPSETAGAHPGTGSGANRVLYVNAFERFDRTINIRQTPYGQKYLPPGHDGNSGRIDRVIPRSVNSFDYVVPHGRAIDAAGWTFDSCSSDAIATGQISLSNYAVVIWAAGLDAVTDKSFTSTEQVHVATYLDAGGALFVSGSEIAYHLDRPSGPSAADRSFLHNYLRVRYSSDNAGSHLLTPIAGRVFSGFPNLAFDDGSGGIYPVQYPDRVLPNGSGSVSSLLYEGGSSGPAAVQYDGSSGGGRVVYLGIPFETILDPTLRNASMGRILEFLDKTGYPLWQEQQFPQAEIDNADISGTLANPSGDGIPNILKYALHLDPHESTRNGLPQISVEGNHLIFRFRQSKAATDITYIIQVSDDLVTWASGPAETEVIGTDDQGDYQIITVRDKTPFPESGRRFIRLQVVQD